MCSAAKVKIKLSKVSKLTDGWEAAFNFAQDPISVHDKNFRIVKVNKAFAQAVGISSRKLIGRKYYEVMRGPNGSRIDCCRKHAVKTRQLKVEEFFEPRSKKFFQVSCSPIFNKQNKITGSVHIARDIAGLKRAEENLRRYLGDRQKLIHANRVLMLNEFVYSFAHEINQPLTAILSNAQAAQQFLSKENPDLAELREILKDIVLADNRASEVIQRLRALLKNKEIKFVKFDINELIKETVLLVDNDAVIKNKFLTVELDQNLPEILGDRVQLQQVLLNLIANGLDSMFDAGPELRNLVVRTSQKDSKTIVVAVQDSGTGFSKKSIEKIFDHFFTTKPNGMGLGLSICSSIVQTHGGKLVAENNSGCGATVYFTLPIPER